MQTRSQVMANEVAALCRARNPFLIINTKEEARAESYLIEAASAAGYVPRMWDIAQGVTDASGRVFNDGLREPDSILDYILNEARSGSNRRGAWIMRDLMVWLSGPMGATTQRRLRNLARTLPGIPLQCAQVIIVISAGGEIPVELQSHATVIDWPLPDRAEIAAILESAISSLPENIREKAAPNGNKEAAIDAAVGLSGEEAAACYAKSLVQTRKIDPATVAKEKKRVIAKEKVLEWHDPIPGGLDAVGGLENLKAWLLTRASAYSKKARAYGLPSPKGALLVGVPGCGKTLTAKAIATAWQVPLLRLDLNALKSKFVGESEGNLRKALRVIEAIGQCIVWIDEVEKALQGATSGSADGGVSADALGTVLSWMQERQGEAFVIATANDVTILPPELLRKGRFDEVFFVDLPTRQERIQVLQASLRGFNRDKVKLDLDAIADATEGFTGSEVASLVPDSMFAAFNDAEREIATPDLLCAAGNVAPLSKMADGKIDRLRKWAEGRARPASKSEAKQESTLKKILDIS